MAQPLQSINLVAPGFKGVNTEDSPIGQDFSFADVADNAVIDKRGRIAARKGVQLLTTNRSLLGTDYAHKVHHFYDDAGNEETFVTGNNEILKVTTTTDPDDTLVDITPSGYIVTGDNWKIVNFNNKAYFFQRGLEPLVYDDATGLRTFGDATGSPTNTNLFCHEALAAYGRLFVVDNGGNTQTIYWSDLLIGTDFSGGSSGSINVAKAWPDGYDEVTCIGCSQQQSNYFRKAQHPCLRWCLYLSSPSMATRVDTVFQVLVAYVETLCRSIGTDVLFVSQDSGLEKFWKNNTRKINAVCLT